MKTISYCILIAIIATLCIVCLAVADIYKYRTPDGRLVISNTPPPEATDIKHYGSQPKQSDPPADSAETPTDTAETPTDAAEPLPTPPAKPRAHVDVAPSRMYVDNHPLGITKSKLIGTGNWWHYYVTGKIENRSTMTQAEDVTVEAVCYDEAERLLDTGSAWHKSIRPRGERTFRIPIILSSNAPPKKLTCKTEVTWNNVDASGRSFGSEQASSSSHLRPAGVGPVHLKGYPRQGGTYVQPPTRRLPQRY